MANQDQTPTDTPEVPADLADSDLEKVVGGELLGGVAGEATDIKHKSELRSIA